MKTKTSPSVPVLCAAALASVLALARPLCAAPTLVSPADYATVEVHSDAVCAYLNDPESTQWQTYASSTVGNEKRKAMRTMVRAESPKVTLGWSGTSGSCAVCVFRVRDSKLVLSTTSDTGAAVFPDAEIGRNYIWTVSDGKAKATGHFYVARTAPRIFNAHGGISNSRDLGGWTAADGKVVKQGMIFRSEEWDYVDDGVYESGCYPKPYWRDTVGIRLDVDLRAASMVRSAYLPSAMPGAGLDKSPIDFSIHRFHSEDGAGAGAFPAYGAINKSYTVSGDATTYTAKQGRLAVYHTFTNFVNAKSYPIIFHCSQGKDRTGTLAYLLNGLLGVSRADLDLDYAVTFTWDDDYKLSSWSIDGVYSAVNGYNGTGDLPAKITSYLQQCYKDAGRTAAEATADVAAFRALMLEDPEPAAAAPVQKFDAEHTIVCYGDSLTEGTGGDEGVHASLPNYFDGRLDGVRIAESYPYRLSQMVPAEYNVLAQALAGVPTDTILAWQGGRALMTSQALTLPAAAGEYVDLAANLLFDGTDGGYMHEKSPDKPHYFGCLAPFYPLVGEIPHDGETFDCRPDAAMSGWLGDVHVRVRGRYPTYGGEPYQTICRTEPAAAAAAVPVGTRFVPDAAVIYSNAIQVICAGANDGTARVTSHVIPQLKAAVKGVPRYVVVCPHTLTASGETRTQTTATKAEQAFAEAFGDHCLNLRLELVNRGVAAAKALGYSGVTKWNNQGATGLLCTSDTTHFNAAGYAVFARFVHEKLVKLGYVPGTVEREPGQVTWAGAGGNWTTDANWAEGYAPTADDYALFPSGNAVPWAVCLDADCEVADFYAVGSTTFSGGHALTAHVSGRLSPTYYVFARGTLTAAGTGTAVRVKAESMATLGGGTSLVAKDGAALSVEKLSFSDNGNMLLWADGADSVLAFTLGANKTLRYKYGDLNTNIVFKATDGGTLAFNSGAGNLTFDLNTKIKLLADGGTLDMTKAKTVTSCNDLTLTVAHGGFVNLASADLSGGTVNLTPDATWNGTDAHITAAGNLKLGSGVKYAVNVSTWTGGTAKLAVAKAGGTLTFTAPTANVALSGTGAENFSATLAKDGTSVCLTLTMKSPAVGGSAVAPGDVFAEARTAKPIVYPSAPDVTGTPGNQEIAYGGVTAKVPAHYTATLAGNVVKLALNDNARPTIADATEDARRGFELKDGQVTVHAVPSAAGLFYTLESATDLGGASGGWERVAGPQADADFAVDAAGAKRFYRITVTD